MGQMADVIAEGCERSAREIAAGSEFNHENFTTCDQVRRHWQHSWSVG